jgi:archaellum component FlaC
MDRRLMKRALSNYAFEGITFYKTTTEIHDHATQMVENLLNEINETVAKAELLAKKHELSYEEVYNEEVESVGEMRDAVSSAYVTKAMGSITPTRANTNILQQIQADMSKLAGLIHNIFRLQGEIENFKRISSHITPTIIELKNTTHKLTYSQLAELGFE